MKYQVTAVLSLAFAITPSACSLESADTDEYGQAQQETRAASLNSYSLKPIGKFHLKRDCVRSSFYWRDHPGQWPVRELRLGSEDYSKRSLLGLLRTEPWGDASIVLAHELIAAKLNVAAGAHTSLEVALTIAVANRWMIQNRDQDGRLPFDSPAGTEEQTRCLLLARSLAVFNQGGNGTKSCE